MTRLSTPAKAPKSFFREQEKNHKLISLFAQQEMRTLFPIPETRLNKKLAKIEKSGIRQ